MKEVLEKKSKTNVNIVKHEHCLGKLAKYKNYEPVSISRNFYKFQATCLNHNTFNISFDQDDAIEKHLKTYAKSGNRIHGIGIKLLSAIETVEIDNNSYNITITNGVMENNIPDTNTKAMMEVIIEAVCNSCDKCNNFTKQHEKLQQSNSLSYVEFQDFFNMPSLEMTRIMVDVLKDHIAVKKIQEVKPLRQRKTNRPGIIGDLYDFMVKNDKTLFEYKLRTKKRSLETDADTGNDTKRPKLFWTRCHGISWQVATDAFNKMHNKDGAAVTSDALRKVLPRINKYLQQGVFVSKITACQNRSKKKKETQGIKKKRKRRRMDSKTISSTSTV